MLRLIGSKLGWRGVFLGLLALAVGLMVATPRLVQGQARGGGAKWVTASSVDRVKPRFAERRAEIDADTYTRVSRLRRALGLTRDDLAAMGMDQTQAAALLSSLKEFCERRAGEFARLEDEQRRARRERAALLGRVNAGTAPPTWRRDLARWDEATARARASERQLIEQAEALAEGSLDTSQRKVRETAAANAGRRGLLRYVEADARPGPATRLAGEPAVARSQNRPEQKLARSLTATQRQSLRVVADRLDRGGEDIAAAEYGVFSVPLPGGEGKTVLPGRTESLTSP